MHLTWILSLFLILGCAHAKSNDPVKQFKKSLDLLDALKKEQAKSGQKQSLKQKAAEFFKIRRKNRGSKNDLIDTDDLDTQSIFSDSSDSSGDTMLTDVDLNSSVISSDLGSENESADPLTRTSYAQTVIVDPNSQSATVISEGGIGGPEAPSAAVNEDTFAIPSDSRDESAIDESAPPSNIAKPKRSQMLKKKIKNVFKKRSKSSEGDAIDREIAVTSADDSDRAEPKRKSMMKKAANLFKRKSKSADGAEETTDGDSAELSTSVASVPKQKSIMQKAANVFRRKRRSDENQEQLQPMGEYEGDRRTAVTETSSDISSKSKKGSLKKKFSKLFKREAKSSNSAGELPSENVGEAGEPGVEDSMSISDGRPSAASNSLRSSSAEFADDEGDGQ